jgi:hypothetical protein
MLKQMLFVTTRNESFHCLKTIIYLVRANYKRGEMFIKARKSIYQGIDAEVLKGIEFVFVWCKNVCLKHRNTYVKQVEL